MKKCKTKIGRWKWCGHCPTNEVKKTVENAGLEGECHDPTKEKWECLLFLFILFFWGGGRGREQDQKWIMDWPDIDYGQTKDSLWLDQG